jgi:hypothetical protein
MDEWKHAHEIEELNSFKVIPPPIKQVIATPRNRTTRNFCNYFRIKEKSLFFSNIILAILQSYLFSISFKIIKEELDLKNKQTEFSNEKLHLNKTNLTSSGFKTKLEKE